MNFMNRPLKKLEKMLKKRLYLRHFLVSRRLLRFFANYFFWMSASRFVIIEPTFCERDNFKTLKNLFYLSDYCCA